MSVDGEPARAEPAASGLRVRRPRRRTVLAAAGIAVLLLAVLGAVLLVSRYLPALDDARALRGELEGMVERVRDAGLDVDRTTLDALDADLVSARARLNRVRSVVDGDILVGIARVLPPTASTVRGADGLLRAGEGLLDAVEDGLAVGRRFVELREVRAATPGGGSVLADLVELVAITRPRVVSAAASIDDARLALATVPADVPPLLADARDAMGTRIERFLPLLDEYLVVSDRLPAILGWDEPRRYLVLTQDPAELRPTGGFVGTYAIVSLDRGRVTGLDLRETGPLDYPFDYPWIEPPQELVDYLLGPDQPWQFADANWSPDFPTSARDALRLYANQTGEAPFDGVLGITTYTIDELLAVTGALEVPGYGVTIAPGETTIKVLVNTRAPQEPGQEAKAFLFTFARHLLDELLGLAPDRWPGLVGAAGAMRDERLLQAWFVDPADQAMAVAAGVDGSIRQDPGDYLYAVDANVAPVSKLNAWTSRSLDLEVEIDELGNARHTLRVTWENRVETAEGAVYRALDNVGGLDLGLYERLLVPERSRLESIQGGGVMPVTNPAVVEELAGRMVIGTYLRVTPGTTTMTYAWTSPYAADADETGGLYRLTVQRQPGLVPGPVTITIRVPDGARIVAASESLAVDGGTATLATALARDLVVGLRYEP